MYIFVTNIRINITYNEITFKITLIILIESVEKRVSTIPCYKNIICMYLKEKKK